MEILVSILRSSRKIQTPGPDPGSMQVSKSNTGKYSLFMLGGLLPELCSFVLFELPNLYCYLGCFLHLMIRF